MNDSSLLTFYCLNCGEQAACVNFIRQNSDKYICLGKCENGEECFVRFEFAKGIDGTFSGVRMVYETDEGNSNFCFKKTTERKEGACAFRTSCRNGIIFKN